MEGNNVIQPDLVRMVTVRPLDLPDFSNPPVAETVLSVQFDRLSAIRTAHFGLFWGELRDRFPETAEQVELPSVIERQPDQLQPSVGIQFEALEAPPSPRFWFVNKDGTELIQLQRDRFLKNWRKTGETDSYPRYERIRQGFDSDLECFLKFVTLNKLGTVRVNQYEVSYVNHIVAGEGWKTHSEIERVFTCWRQPIATHPGQVQDLAFRARYPIYNKDGIFVGRLYATLQSATRLTDGTPMFVFDLTARGQCVDGIDFFDLGRECIVRSFAEFTTPTMHHIWGRRR